MEKHRLPGMSVSSEQWAALAARAAALGITRTELIRESIARLLDGDPTPEVEARHLRDELTRTKAELVSLKAAAAALVRLTVESTADQNPLAAA